MNLKFKVSKPKQILTLGDDPGSLGPKRSTGEFGKCTRSLQKIAKKTDYFINYGGDSTVNWDSSGNVIVHTTNGEVKISGGTTSCTSSSKEDSYNEASKQIQFLVDQYKFFSSAPQKLKDQIELYRLSLDEVLDSCSETQNDKINSVLKVLRSSWIKEGTKPAAQ